MKKLNKYRTSGNGNNNNAIFSLNYKFDSSSIAGKVNGTALELIRRYNELAKDAHANNDYVTAEIFRQYAEHYRKIVTDINERKGTIRNFEQPLENKSADTDEVAEETPVATKTAAAQAEVTDNTSEQAEAPKNRVKRSFKIIDISKPQTPVATEEGATPAPKRVYHRKPAAG